MRVVAKFLILLCFVSGGFSKPTVESSSDLITTGRGIGSTIWGWLTYPFSWWSSEPEPPPVNEQLIGSTPFAPEESVEIGKHNVTVWCNDQTCTTIKCNMFGCRKITCNIYDTDLMGECREYNILSTSETPVKPTEPIQKPVEDKVIESPPEVPVTTHAPFITSTIKDTYLPREIPLVEEHATGLEAALSSTINQTKERELHDKIVVLNPEQKV